MTMRILTVQHIGDKQPTHIITVCEDTDTCPGCGAGYKVGMSACEYCKTPVQIPEPTTEQVVLKLIRALNSRKPHYRDDIEAIEAAKGWLQRSDKACP